MAYDKISAHEFIIDTSNIDDILFVEHCKKYDNQLMEIIKNIEFDSEEQPLLVEKSVLPATLITKVIEPIRHFGTGLLNFSKRI